MVVVQEEVMEVMVQVLRCKRTHTEEEDSDDEGEVFVDDVDLLLKSLKLAEICNRK